MTPQEMVREFHEAINGVVRTSPTMPVRSERELRQRLVVEEAQEVCGALAMGGIPAVARELADLIYVTYGAALHYGIDLDAVVAEVHRANMGKVFPDGTTHRREDGKVLKPEGWTPPDVAGVLGL